MYPELGTGVMHGGIVTLERQDMARLTMPDVQGQEL